MIRATNENIILLIDNIVISREDGTIALLSLKI